MFGSDSCSFTPRATTFLIAVINLAGCLDGLILRCCRRDSNIGEILCSARQTLVAIFQLVNLLLLLATILENATLIQIYLWYTLGFILMGLIVELAFFLMYQQQDGFLKSLMVFVPEVAFLFVVCLCLPLVDEYRKQINMSGKRTPASSPSSSRYSTSSSGSYSGIKLQMKPQ